MKQMSKRRKCDARVDAGMPSMNVEMLDTIYRPYVASLPFVPIESAYADPNPAEMFHEYRLRVFQQSYGSRSSSIFSRKTCQSAFVLLTTTQARGSPSKNLLKDCTDLQNLMFVCRKIYEETTELLFQNVNVNFDILIS